MSDENGIGKAELLARIQQGWDELDAYAKTLSEAQLTGPTDAAGWTAKDHLMHLAVWADGVLALLNHQSRQERMGIDAATWKNGDIDQINALIQQQHKGMAPQAVTNALRDIHEQLMDRVQSLSDDDLRLPYSHYQTPLNRDRPVASVIIDNTGDHYTEHLPWIKAIVNRTDDTPASKAELLARMQRGWDELDAYVKTLSEAQLTGPTDAAGWTAKDHLMHLAVWADGITAMLNGGVRRERMGLDAETWQSRDFDRMNAVIQQAHKDKPLSDVLAALSAAHQALYAKAQSLSDDDLRRPYNYFDPTSPQDRPIIGWIIGDSYGHYEEHMPWIDAIVK